MKFKLRINPKYRKAWVITLCAIFGIALGAAVYAGLRHFIFNDSFGGSGIFAKKSPKPDTTANPLDGTQAPKDKANRHPLAIIVENHTDARPQVGLDKASIVYEAIAEGGITRFMAVFGPNDADKVGPVRSLRTFFLDWAHEYDAFLAHVGGNIDALDRVPEENTKDLDQFSVGSKAYWREPRAGIATEHTMFTSTDKLYEVAKEKGWSMEADFTPFKFLKDKDFKPKTNVNQKITINFSSASYKVVYDYSPTGKNYPRSMAGTPHKDRNTGDQLAPTNLIIQSVSRTHAPTRINEESWKFDTEGSGDAIVLYGGQKFDCTWKKDSLTARTKFYDKNTDEEMKFPPGQFWYEVVPPDVFQEVTIETTTFTPTPSPKPSAS